MLVIVHTSQTMAARLPLHSTYQMSLADRRSNAYGYILQSEPMVHPVVQMSSTLDEVRCQGSLCCVFQVRVGGGGGGGGLGRQMQNVGRSWTQKRYKIKHAPPSDTPSAMASFINRLLTWLLWLLPANPNGPKDTMCLEKYILQVVMAILVISWLGVPCGVPLESLSAIVSWHCENQEPEGRKGSRNLWKMWGNDIHTHKMHTHLSHGHIPIMQIT